MSEDISVPDLDTARHKEVRNGGRDGPSDGDLTSQLTCCNHTAPYGLKNVGFVQLRPIRDSGMGVAVERSRSRLRFSSPNHMKNMKRIVWVAKRQGHAAYAAGC